MLARFFYTFSFLILLPVSLLLIFRPQSWQNFYTQFYWTKIEPRGNPFLRVIGKSLLTMISSDMGTLLHQALGIFLGIVTLWIFLEKLRIISFSPLS